MSKIDVSQWKEFKVGDLFIKISTKKLKYRTRDLPKMPDAVYNLPASTASVINQGLSVYVPKNGATILHKCLLVLANGDAGTVFYEPESFTVLQDSYALKLKRDVNKYDISNVYLFLASVLTEIFHYKFGWDNKAVWSRASDLTIRLPVTKDGQPNWQYMDEYIAKRAALAHKYVSELKSAKKQRTPLKISGWQEYKISQLFSVRPSKYVRENGKVVSNRKLLDDGPNPVVVNSSVNNGIGGTTSYEPTEHGNVITYSDTVDGNTIFYQAKPFVGYSHVKVMEPKEKRNPAEMIFLTAVIGRRLSDGNYDYTNKMTTNRVLNTTIMLPALSDGTPDWATMRKRVADLAALSHKYVSKLRLVTGM